MEGRQFRQSQPCVFPCVLSYEERQSPFPSRLPILGFSVLSHGESIFCCVEAHGPNTKQRWTSNTNGREFCSWTTRLEGKPWAKGCETFENLRICGLSISGISGTQRVGTMWDPYPCSEEASRFLQKWTAKNQGCRTAELPDARSFLSAEILTRCISRCGTLLPSHLIESVLVHISLLFSTMKPTLHFSCIIKTWVLVYGTIFETVCSKSLCYGVTWPCWDQDSPEFV